MLKLMVIVMIALAESEAGQEERIACAAFHGIGLSTDGVTGAVD